MEDGSRNERDFLPTACMGEPLFDRKARVIISGMAPKVYIVVLNWNNWSDTLECLESLYRLDYPAFEVIVCDNASTDGSVAMIEQWAKGEVVAPCRSADAKIRALTQPPIPKPIPVRKLHAAQASVRATAATTALTVIQMTENRGYASGNNAGIRLAQARGDAAFIWILNNDTVVAPNALFALVERAAKDPRIGLCGSLLMFYDEPSRVQAAGGGVYRPAIAIPLLLGAGHPPNALPPAEEIETRLTYVVGASMLVSAAFIEEVGPMREDYFLYYEEIDWVMRARNRFKLGFAPTSTVYHKEGATAGSTTNWRRRSRISDLCAVRNRLLITRRYFAPYYPLVFATIVGALIQRLIRGQPDRAKDVFRILLGPESYRLPLPDRPGFVSEQRQRRLGQRGVRAQKKEQGKG